MIHVLPPIQTLRLTRIPIKLRVVSSATKSVYELIAESVAFFLMGKKLPKRVQDLVDKTLSYARMTHDKVSKD